MLKKKLSVISIVSSIIASGSIGSNSFAMDNPSSIHPYTSLKNCNNPNNVGNNFSTQNFTNHQIRLANLLQQSGNIMNQSGFPPPGTDINPYSDIDPSQNSILRNGNMIPGYGYNNLGNQSINNNNYNASLHTQKMNQSRHYDPFANNLNYQYPNTSTYFNINRGPVPYIQPNQINNPIFSNTSHLNPNYNVAMPNDNRKRSEAETLLNKIFDHIQSILPSENRYSFKFAAPEVIKRFLKINKSIQNVSMERYHCLLENKINDQCSEYCCWDYALAVDCAINEYARNHKVDIESTTAGYGILGNGASHQYNIFIWNGYIFVIDIMLNFSACADLTDEMEVNSLFNSLSWMQQYSGSEIPGAGVIGVLFEKIKSMKKDESSYWSNPKNVYVRERIWGWPQDNDVYSNHLWWANLPEFLSHLRENIKNNNNAGNVINKSIYGCDSSYKKKGIGFLEA